MYVDSTAAITAKAQQEPHEPWYSEGVTLFSSFQFKYKGISFSVLTFKKKPVNVVIGLLLVTVLLFVVVLLLSVGGTIIGVESSNF